VKNARQAAKQAFNRLEARVLRPDKTKFQLESGVRVQEGEEGVRRKPGPDFPLPPEENLTEEYLSSLT
jgi:hypothetical protein